MASKPKADAVLTVRATRTGFLGFLREPEAVFTCTGEQFAADWMELVDGVQAEPDPTSDAAARDPAALAAAAEAAAASAE